MNSARVILAAAAVLGFVAVALGAFGAHGLKARLGTEALAIWKTAVDYQFHHTLALLLLGLWARQAGAPGNALLAVAACWVGGILLFSGSLYALGLGAPRGLGAVTPLGGLLLLAGWALLLRAALLRPPG